MRSARGTRPGRPGFTLIEVLVVIGLLAFLTALVVGGVGRVRQSQMARSTGDTLSKLQKALDQQWTAVLDEAREPKKIPPDLVTYCNDDLDRAKALWAYASLRREFPQTFAEARSDITINSVTYPQLKARGTYSGLPAGGDGLGTEQQGAVILFLNLSEKGNRGMVFAVDDVTAGAQSEVVGSSGTKYRVFKDAYGTPVTYIRLAQNAELNGPPYVTNAGNPNKNPLDPKAKLSGWPDAARRTAAAAAVGVSAFDQTNKRLTVVSAGPDKTFQLGSPATSDDLYGYRLTRLGNRGD